MSKFLKLVLITVILSVLYASFFLELLGPIINPNLVIAFVLAYEMNNNHNNSMINAFLSGFFLDLVVNNDLLGSTSLFLLVVVLVAHLAKKYFSRTKYINFAICGCANIAYVGLFSSISGVSLLSLLVSSLITIIVCIFMNHIFVRFDIFIDQRSIKMKRI